MMSQPPLRAPNKIFSKAIRLRSAGQLDAAIEQLRQLVKQAPAHLDGQFMLGSYLAEQGALDEAQLHLETARQLNPDSPQILNNLGNVYRLRDDLDGAVRCYQRVLLLAPGFAPALVNLGFIHAKRRNWQGVIDSFLPLGGSESGDPDILNPLAEAYVALGQQAMAERVYERLLQIDPVDRYGAVLALARLRGDVLPARHSDAMVIATYRQKASAWDADVKRSSDHYDGPAHIERLLATRPLPAGAAILDLGCGTGACGEFLAGRAGGLIGVDLSPEMLAQAATKGYYSELHEDEIERYLRGCNRQFDLVVAAGVLIMFSHLESIFAAIHGCLPPGGLLALTLYRSANAAIEIRHNHHFGHSRAYLEQLFAAGAWQVLEWADVVHETEAGQDQAGFAILLQRP